MICVPEQQTLRGGMLFYEVDKDALALLRAMKEYHERHNPDVPLADGTRLAPELVSERIGLAPDTLRFERPVGYLLREGALAGCLEWTSTGLPSGGWSC